MYTVYHTQYLLTCTVHVHVDHVPISNGNRPEWSPIRSVIMRVITKSDDCAVESDLFITSMITDGIGRYEFLLHVPII